MKETMVTRIERKAWVTAFGRESWIRKNATFDRANKAVLCDVQTLPTECFASLICARYSGHKCVTAIEFGVASGTGLLNLVS
jgi:hypothetical protein